MCSPHSSLRKNIWSSVPGLSIPLRGRGIVKEFGERAWVVRGNWTPNGLEMSRPASQGYYRAKPNAWLAGSAPSSC